MFTKKDRKLANEKARVKNRDIIISDMQKQAEVLYEEKKNLSIENEELKDLMNNIYNLASINQYGNANVILSKIKELVSDYQSQN